MEKRGAVSKQIDLPLFQNNYRVLIPEISQRDVIKKFAELIVHSFELVKQTTEEEKK